MDEMLTSGLDKGVGGSRPGCRRISAARQVLKIEFIFFSFSLQKHEKSKKSKNRLYFGGPPRPGIYLWTMFCPKLVKLQFIPWELGD
jgi:hypothetical protein